MNPFAAIRRESILHLLADEFPWADFYIQLRLMLARMLTAVIETSLKIGIEFLRDSNSELPRPFVPVWVNVNIAVFHVTPMIAPEGVICSITLVWSSMKSARFSKERPIFWAITRHGFFVAGERKIWRIGAALMQRFGHLYYLPLCAMP